MKQVTLMWMENLDIIRRIWGVTQSLKTSSYANQYAEYAKHMFTNLYDVMVYYYIYLFQKFRGTDRILKAFRRK